MKPMRKDGVGCGGAALFDMLSETEDDTSSSGDVDVAAGGSCRDESSRWETSRREASNGRSLGVRAYKDGTCKLGMNGEINDNGKQHPPSSQNLPLA